MKLKIGYSRVILNSILYIILNSHFICDSYSYSPSTSTKINFNKGFNNNFFVSKDISNYNIPENEVDNGKFHLLGSFLSRSSLDDVHCGEIVLGTPVKRNDDGTILVDVGLSQPLVASKSSLYFMNEDEHYRLNTILNSKKEQEEHPYSLKRIIQETIDESKKYPERKRKTYLKPKYIYPNDFANLNKKKEENVPYDIGIGSEIRPQDQYRTEEKRPEFLKNIDKMEFLITGMSPYKDHIEGEFFSVNILESKRRMYSNLVLESMSQTSQLVGYEGVLTEVMGEVARVQIVNGKYSEMYGVKGYTLSKPNDKVGDKVKVYLAGSDPGVEKAYFFRTPIGHPILKKENLNVLKDAIAKYYVRSGVWFKAEIDKVVKSLLILRVLGDGSRKCFACVTRDQLPYNYPEKLLNIAFMRKNKPYECFGQRDMEINVGKMNYIYHYDNTLYVRATESYVKGRRYDIKNLPEMMFSTVDIVATTKNCFKPSKETEKYFIKMVNQDTNTFDMIEGKTYPCIVLENEGGYIYFAINNRFKPNFTKEDEFPIGMMEAGQFSTNVEKGTIVHAKLFKVVKYKMEEGFIVDQSKKSIIYRKLPITEWLTNLGKEELKRYNLSEKNELSVFMMNNCTATGLQSPQFREFLFLQPVMLESKFADCLEATQAMSHIFNPNARRQLFTTRYSKSRSNRRHTRKESKYDIGETSLRHTDKIVAPPVYYVHNEELREILMKENLEPFKYRQILQNVESSKFDPHIVIREFFINSKGVPYWEFLENMKNPLYRRKVTLKEALEFERSILKLLSLYHTFYLESIYNMVPKEDIMFASIVPSSFENTYFSMDDLENYYDIVKRDFVMDERVSRSVLNVLRILTHPNYSFMAQFRNRHRRMLNDVFFYSSKKINYPTFKTIKRPFVSRNLSETQLKIPLEEERSHCIPMKPYAEIAASPNMFVNELNAHGLSRLRKIYTTILKYNDTKTKFVKPYQMMRGANDPELYPSDLQTDDPEINSLFDEIDINELALNDLDGSKESLKKLAKGWKRLNRYPSVVTKRDLIDYLEDMKNLKLVHGIKMPII